MSARHLALVALGLAAGATRVEAQGFFGQVGRLYDDGGWTLYRVGVGRPLAGPIALTYHGDYLSRSSGEAGAFAGLGVDVTAFHTGGQGPYVVGGVGGGLGSPHSKSYSSLWTSWSAGAGYDLQPAPFLTFGTELRWRQISLDHRGGLELAAGLGFRLGGGRTRPPVGAANPAVGDPARSSRSDRPAGLPPRAAAPASSASPATAGGGSAALADSVVETAAQMMGRKYEYGGNGEGDDGFDCSGLIQYAYAHHGIALPRRSQDQALSGRAVARDLDLLRPGDLLTFSSTGGPVTHVALYIGNGQFIHSASGGVQISLLSSDDPYGKWWYQRWVGARRILGA